MRELDFPKEGLQINLPTSRRRKDRIEIVIDPVNKILTVKRMRKKAIGQPLLTSGLSELMAILRAQVDSNITVSHSE